MSHSTHTTTTTDDVITIIVQQVRSRIDALDSQMTALARQRNRLAQALDHLTDAGAPAQRDTLTEVPTTEATALQQVAEAGRTIKAIKIAASTNGKQAPLQHVIHELLIADGPMKPTAIANTLLAYGYQTKAQHFTQVVYMALKKFKGHLFEQAGDGHWQPATARKRKAAR